MATASDDDGEEPDLEPLPEDFVVPDDASALEHDRAAHRLSGLPELDPILVRLIITFVVGFVATFAMFTGITSRMMSCTTEIECTAAGPGPIPGFLVLFTPLLTAACALIGYNVAKSQAARRRWLTASIILPIVCATVYFILL